MKDYECLQDALIERRTAVEVKRRSIFSAYLLVAKTSKTVSSYFCPFTYTLNVHQGNVQQHATIHLNCHLCCQVVLGQRSTLSRSSLSAMNAVPRPSKRNLEVESMGQGTLRLPQLGCSKPRRSSISSTTTAQ